MVRRHYLITGRVQGVGFRRFVEKQALALRLKGKVRNLYDGRVEAIAFGDEGAVQEFEKLLAQGPASSHVEHIEKQSVDDDALAGIVEFSVTRDGEEPWFTK